MTVAISNLTATWNSGGTTFSAIKMDVTDTASAAASMLLDMRVATVEKFAVTKAGLGRFASSVHITSALANALAVGRQGTTDPGLSVDASVASCVTGIKITPAAAAAGVAVVVTSSGTNENLTVDAKGSGTLSLNATATGLVTTPRKLQTTGPTAGLGYGTGAGGAVTQITSAATGVTLNTVCGQITTVALTTAGAAEEEFTVTNSAVAATDVIVLSTTYAGAGTPMLSVKGVAAGSFKIVITNVSASALNALMVINFAVIKAVAA
jgi:hypothetical protein